MYLRCRIFFSCPVLLFLFICSPGFLVQRGTDGKFSASKGHLRPDCDKIIEHITRYTQRSKNLCFVSVNSLLSGSLQKNIVKMHFKRYSETDPSLSLLSCFFARHNQYGCFLRRDQWPKESPCFAQTGVPWLACLDKCQPLKRRKKKFLYCFINLT